MAVIQSKNIKRRGKKCTRRHKLIFEIVHKRNKVDCKQKEE